MIYLMAVLLLMFVTGWKLMGRPNAPKYDDWAAALVIFPGIAIAILLAGYVGSYVCHANDLGVIEAQHYKVQVYKEQIQDLNKMLESFKYPKASTFANGDSPIASVVAELGKANAELAKAKEEIAEAKISIVQRKKGLWKATIWIVGE